MTRKELNARAEELGLTVTSRMKNGEVEQMIKSAEEASIFDTDVPAVEETPAVEAAEETVKQGRGWLYHGELPPRIFEDGEVVPDGWNMENFKLWRVDDQGVFVNVNR